MKLNGTQRQAIKSALTSETELPQNTKSNSLEVESPNTVAGSTSKLGEFYGQSNQIKQNLFAKLQTANQTSGFGTEATVTKTRDKVIIDAGAGDDKIGITQDAKTGDVTVEVNGKKQIFTGKDKDNLVIKAGEGNDSIKVNKGVYVTLTMEGNAGNDKIEVDTSILARQKIYGGAGDDQIKGGAGDDCIEGGEGNDTIIGGDGRNYINGSKGDDTIIGGTGNEVIYGGDGNDKITGGDGNDYLEGGTGNDTIEGGAGNDVLSGGIGDDTLKGGDGNDAIYAGQGKDNLFGEKGINKIYSQKEDVDDSGKKGITNTVVTVELKGSPGNIGIVIQGSDEFRERVEADLEMLRSSEKGRKMLEAFDTANAKNKVTLTVIEETNDFNEFNPQTNKYETTTSYADWANRTNQNQPQPYLVPQTDAKGKITGWKNGTPNNATVGYRTSEVFTANYADGTTSEEIPITVLYHEMAHAADFTAGTYRQNTYQGKGASDKGQTEDGERVAVGLPIDHDGDPTTSEQLDTTNHADELTENALREEMNLPKRQHYIPTNRTHYN